MQSLPDQIAHRRVPCSKLSGSPTLTKVAEQLNYLDLDQLYAGIGEGHVSAKAVVQRIQRELRGGEEQLPTTVARPMMACQPGWMQEMASSSAHNRSMPSKSPVENAA